MRTLMTLLNRQLGGEKAPYFFMVGESRGPSRKQCSSDCGLLLNNVQKRCLKAKEMQIVADINHKRRYSRRQMKQNYTFTS
jgi:hypothetical protein